jgi:hypothetical protein
MHADTGRIWRGMLIVRLRSVGGGSSCSEIDIKDKGVSL